MPVNEVLTARILLRLRSPRSRCTAAFWPAWRPNSRNSCQLATRTARISCWRPGARLPFTSVPGPVRPRHRPAAYPLDWRPGKCFKCKNSVFKRVIQYWNVRYRCIFMSIGRIFYKCICVQPIFVLMLMISRSSGFVSLSSFFFSPCGSRSKLFCCADQ